MPISQRADRILRLDGRLYLGAAQTGQTDHQPWTRPTRKVIQNQGQGVVEDDIILKHQRRRVASSTQRRRMRSWPKTQPNSLGSMSMP